MRIWEVVLLCGATALLLEGTSFTSPLFPEHSRKFYMLGSAIPLRTSVRVVPGSQRKTGSIVGMNPISEKEFSIEVSGTMTGKQLADDEGALTIWFTPTYARHIAVGSLYGVNPRIQGVLVVYAYRKGLIGFEKASEDAITPEEVPTAFQCAPQTGLGFNFTMTFSETSLTVEYDLSGTRLFCFTMPIKPTAERFIGLSGLCGFPCQRGIDIYSLQTQIVVNDQRFIEKMRIDNEKLDSMLAKISAEFETAGKELKVKYEPGDLEKIIGMIEETKNRLAAISSRISQWQARASSVIESEKSDEKSLNYFKSLSETLFSLEKTFDELILTASQLNVGKVVEEYIKANVELVGNERQINSMMRTMQKAVGSFQMVALSDEKFYVVYGGFGVVVAVGAYLYWRLRKAGKRHEL